jgi:hypothetical protein
VDKMEITKLEERVSKVAELIFEHKNAAFNLNTHAIKRLFNTKQQIKNYLWLALHKTGIDNSELGLRLLETKYATLEQFQKYAQYLNSVWVKIVLDILYHGVVEKCNLASV